MPIVIISYSADEVADLARRDLQDRLGRPIMGSSMSKKSDGGWDIMMSIEDVFKKSNAL